MNTGEILIWVVFVLFSLYIILDDIRTKKRDENRFWHLHQQDQFRQRSLKIQEDLAKWRMTKIPKASHEQLLSDISSKLKELEK